jgi:acyl-CoA reductase-like NAD-dependent aldehyde dehydrogenase
VTGTAEKPARLTTADWLERAAAVAPRTEAFIDGRFVAAASGETVADVAGRDGSTIAEVASGGVEDVDRAVGAARASFDDRRWSDRAPTDRKKVLLRFAERIREQRDELALLESLDVGKPIRDTLAVDVPSAAKTIQWYAETIDKVYGEVGPTGPDALSFVTREPIGVVAAIVPWNYPLIITAWKIGAALATGNSVVLKPASQSPLTALRLAELASEAGLPDGVLNVVPGPGAVVGPALARHPAVDKITFTGSTEVGKSLLRAVGETDVKAITLELGGKSPQVVLADVGDLEAAASAIGWGIFYNSGQTCNAGSRLVVHRSIRRWGFSWRRVSRSTLRRGWAPSWMSASSRRCSGTWRSAARRAPASSPVASGFARTAAASSSRRRSSTASPTPGAWPARRSSGRS